MPHLKITITASVPLPRNAVEAANLTVQLTEQVLDVARCLSAAREDSACTCSVTATQDDEPASPAAPKPERRRRRTRVELDAARKTEDRDPPGVSTTVVATPVSLDALRAVGRLSNTTASDGLAPHAGADPGPYPEFLERIAR